MSSLTKEARARILSLEQDDRITAEAVVEDAKNPKSPLHSFFEWDVKKAAREHWLDTARELIRSVRVVIEHRTTVVRAVAYVRDPEAGPREQGYRSVSSLATEREMAEEALRYEARRAVAAIRRVKEVAEALEIDVPTDFAGLAEIAEGVTVEIAA